MSLASLCIILLYFSNKSTVPPGVGVVTDEPAAIAVATPAASQLQP